MVRWSEVSGAGGGGGGGSEWRWGRAVEEEDEVV